MLKQVYWDSCVFIGLLQEEPGKVQACKAIWREAELGKLQIVTSVFTFVEVLRVKCELKVMKPLPPEQDKPIETMLDQKWVVRVLLDEAIAKSARQLVRQWPECKKPADGVHLATALRMNVAEMHTFDGSDLLKLSGKILKKDNHFLQICRPKAPVHDGFMFGESSQIPSQPEGS